VIATIVRMVPETVKEQIAVADSVTVNDVVVHFVTREEALRLYCLMANDGKDHSRIRNYELESYLREWTGLGESKTFVINEWCPFNGAWCAWTRYMPLDEVRRLLVDSEVHPSAKDYLKRERPEAHSCP